MFKVKKQVPEGNKKSALKKTTKNGKDAVIKKSTVPDLICKVLKF